MMTSATASLTTLALEHRVAAIHAHWRKPLREPSVFIGLEPGKSFDASKDSAGVNDGGERLGRFSGR